ncbi:MAG: hypothetical protein EBU84_22380, partial [Actinobacteria bacterium]|nr:hypothetical protein [Actinomycetota bacterium]
DNDCDNQIDDDDSDVTGQPIWYRSPEDADGDGYNSKDIDHDPTDTRNQLVSCNQPDGFQAEPVTGDDCKDSDPLFYPGAVETCDGEDNDCDTLVDEDLPTKTYYLDADSDGYGDTSNATENCDLDNSPLFTQTPGDCADNDAKINPLATEVCDSKDNNCDGSIDENVTTKLYADTDGDGYGDKNSSIEGCSVSGYVTDNSDCDDTDININPAATEVCDGIDNNCNLYVDAQDANNPSEPVGVDMKTWYIDGDADTYGVDTLIQVACSQADAESTWGGSFAFASQNGDCNDNEVSVNPSASELCDGVDNNCNGIIDDGATGGATSTFYADKDGDNYGNAAD